MERYPTVGLPSVRSHDPNQFYRPGTERSLEVGELGCTGVRRVSSRPLVHPSPPQSYSFVPEVSDWSHPNHSRIPSLSVCPFCDRRHLWLTHSG